MTAGIVQSINAILKPLGFMRREGAWNRPRKSGLVDLVSVQLDKAGRRITVEAGVLHPVAFTKCWNKAVPDFVDTPECTIRTRVGELTEGSEHWWALEEPGVAHHIVDRIGGELLPFLDRNHSDAAVESTLAASGPVKWLRAPETVYLAILQHDKGDLAGSCALLQRFREKVLGNWRPRADTLMKQLDCPSGAGSD